MLDALRGLLEADGRRFAVHDKRHVLRTSRGDIAAVRDGDEQAILAGRRPRSWMLADLCD
jgi:hypothetical protein